MPILETNSRAWLGKDYLELKAWCDDVNYNGADIQAGMWGDWKDPVCSDTYPTPGQIIEYACYYGTSDLADGCGRPLNNYSRINMKVSSGACEVKPEPAPEPVASDVVLTSNDIKSLEAINTFCGKVAGCTYEVADMEPAIKIEVIDKNGNVTTYHSKESFNVVIKSDSTIKVYYRKTPDPTTNNSNSNNDDNNNNGNG
jgi:hypothetical protein